MKKNKQYILSLILIFFTSLTTVSQTKYYTYLNDFKGFKNNYNEITDKTLVLKNKSTDTQYNLVDFDCSNSEFTISLKFANESNLSGKKYKVFDSMNNTFKISNPNWGFIWNFKDDLNYLQIKLSGFNSLLHDILDERKLIVEIIKVSMGKKEIIKTESFNNEVDLYDGYNSLWLKYDGTYTSLYIGKKKPVLIYKTQDIKYDNHMKTGFFAGPGSVVKLERFTTKKNILKEKVLTTKWQNKNINKYLKSDTLELIEGIWKYFDRNIDESRLKLGGKYSLVIVKNDQKGYDILYYDGAVINNTKWTTGMLKGRLYPTPFKDNFNLQWYDSTLQLVDDDNYATIEDNNIISFFFPTEKGEIRFIKQ